MYPSHDQLFKDLIRAFPQDFLRLVVPGQAARLSLDTLELQPTETFLDMPRGRELRMDLLLRAESRSGAPVLLHVEVEADFGAGMAERLWSYNRLVRLRLALPVCSVVLYLRGGPPGLRPGFFLEPWVGREICRFRYVSLGLSGASAAEFLRRRNPLAWALAALMRYPKVGRAVHQLACLTPIARARGLNEAQRFLLYNVVRTYLQLTGDAARRQEALLAERRHREVRKMVITWADRMIEQGIQQGLEKGRQEGLREGRQEGVREGRQEGVRDLVLRLLSRRFSPLPAAISRRVAAIESPEELSRLADRILDARSLDELGLA